MMDLTTMALFRQDQPKNFDLPHSSWRKLSAARAGVTLTEAMVGVALLSLLVFVVLKVFNNYFQGSLNNEVRRVRNEFALALARNLSNPLTCGKTFSPSNLQRRRLNTLPNIRGGIRDNSNAVLYARGSTYFDNSIRIESLQTQDYEDPAPGDTIAGITVVATLRYMKASGVLPKNITVTYRVNIEVDPVTSAVTTFNGTAAEPAKCSVGVYREYVQNNEEGGLMTGQLLIIPGPPANAATTMGLELVNAAMKADFFVDSDRRYKEHIHSMSQSLERVESLKPRRFKWKSSHQKDLGFIAQDLKAEFPELVREHRNNKSNEDLLSVSYNSLIAINIGATQELAKQQKLNRQELDSLEQRIERIQKRSRK